MVTWRAMENVTVLTCVSRGCRTAKLPGLAAGAVAMLCAFVLVVAFAATPLRAGNVFMKNGYIIQGKIVDRDADSVVLGWPNGKVTIHNRFIESVTLEVAEEQNLRELEAARRAEIAGASQEDPNASLASPSPDLPGSLEEFMKPYLAARAKKAQEEKTVEGEGANGELVVEAADPEGGPPEGGATSPGGEEGTPEVTLIKPPAVLLAEPVQDEDRMITVRPPQGWTVSDAKGALQFLGQADAKGFRPKLVIVQLEKGAASPADYAKFLAEEQGRTLERRKVLKEGWREVSGEKVYEVVASGSFRGRELVVRHCLAVKKENVWLVSCFSADREPSGAFGLMDEALKTVQFVGR
jgi:hypothetical protein